ncbi:hypothetical protein KSS87_012537, partial [Heliosperma pusillum]
VEQLHKIFKLCGSPSEEYWKKSKLPHATIFKPQQPYLRCVTDTFKEFPPPALSLLESLLSIDPADRGSASSALKNEFFTTKPLPCDPSSLPKYPPSKELDAKMRDEEARRQGAAGSRGHKADPEKKVTRESRAIPAPDANAELVMSIQKRQAQFSSKSRSEKFNNHQEEVASGFPIEPRRASHAIEEPGTNRHAHSHKQDSHSGPLVHQAAWAKAGKKSDDNPKLLNGADLSTIVGSLAPRRSLISEDKRKRTGSFQADASKLIARFPGSFKDASESRRDQVDHMHSFANPLQNEARNNRKDPILLGYGSKGNQVHYSGPLIKPSGNTDEMMKDHDRQIQEAVRRARLDKARLRKSQAQTNQLSMTSLFVSGRVDVNR